MVGSSAQNPDPLLVGLSTSTHQTTMVIKGPTHRNGSLSKHVTDCFSHDGMTTSQIPDLEEPAGQLLSRPQNMLMNG